MFEHVYRDSDAKQEEGKAKHVVEQLFLYYLRHMDELPEEFTRHIAAGWSGARGCGLYRLYDRSLRDHGL